MVALYYQLDVTRVNSCTVQRLKDAKKPLPEGQDKHMEVSQVPKGFSNYNYLKILVLVHI
jgi:hypothetical protein